MCHLFLPVSLPIWFLHVKRQSCLSITKDGRQNLGSAGNWTRDLLQITQLFTWNYTRSRNHTTRPLSLYVGGACLWDRYSWIHSLAWVPSSSKYFNRDYRHDRAADRYCAARSTSHWKCLKDRVLEGVKKKSDSPRSFSVHYFTSQQRLILSIMIDVGVMLLMMGTAGLVGLLIKLCWWPNGRKNCNNLPEKECDCIPKSSKRSERCGRV